MLIRWIFLSFTRRPLDGTIKLVKPFFLAKNGNIMMIRKTNISRLVEQLEKPNLPFWKLDCVLYNFQIQDFYVKCVQDGYF